MNNIPDYFGSIDAAITISDNNNCIVYMNQMSRNTFPDVKVGDSLNNCHKQSSIDTIKKMQSENTSNTYTIEKNGIHKLIHQTPYLINGKQQGLIEFSIVLPDNMPHKTR